ncbi:hypothetical protein [Acinetobacter schindleri]|uniref:hypothetical protein n=1 Tax=Acinetobacter schindleri TaxID=108981 RepID=UPI001D176632|nr:hypothetical protein [Acinetobacter schindleri]
MHLLYLEINKIFSLSCQPICNSALSIVFLGLTLIGYTNAATLLNNKMKHTLYLHSILVILLFATDLIFGNKDLLFTILRNVGFFVVLQFGVYLYVKKQPMSFKEFLKLT